MVVKNRYFKICFLPLTISFVGCKTWRENVYPLEANDQISYEYHVKKIINKNCAGCHSEFVSFTGFKQGVATGKVLERISNETNPMPPYGLMDKSDRRTIDLWLENNFKQN